MRQIATGIVGLSLLASPAATSAFDVESEARAEIVRLGLIVMKADEPTEDFILSRDVARRAVERGVLSGMLEGCNAEWENGSYLHFMAGVRRSKRFDQDQLAAIGFFHGFSMQRSQDELGAGKSIWCSPERLETLQSMALRQDPW
ncbi:hypothetical protein [Sphingopyxis sp. KK2]|uniref:hypothetical protein n=1 Tax=Sphingopyxis sp. KK2 TaxID=1855727 RepID=UPI00097E58D2|nr:hypothetical protein [Sphingopyxis sp. KK2]